MNLTNLDGVTVLVIDDYELVLQTIADTLSVMGAQVLLARNGRVGIERAKRYRPDVVVSNYSMPEANGLEVLRALRDDARTAEIPFVFMTSQASPTLRARCHHVGVDAYLDKTTDVMDLIETVAGVLREAEQGR